MSAASAAGDGDDSVRPTSVHHPSARVRLEAALLDAAPERDALRALTHRAVLLVDDVPHDAPASGPRLRLFAGPFTAEELVTEVRRLVG